MTRTALAVAALIAAAPAVAEVQPRPGNGDPHLQVVDYAEGQIVQLRAAPGYQLMVELSPDEQIRNVAIGDSGAWQVSASKEGDRLFIKPTAADSATNMTVVTSVRTYAFDLVAVPGVSGDVPYTVQFHYPPPPVLAAGDDGYVDVSSVRRRLSRYRIAGDKALRPNSVSDDGQHTFISWPRGAEIPAVYAPGAAGSEVLLNGMMGTDDVYVVDGAPQKLIFRVDRSVARADRVAVRKKR